MDAEAISGVPYSHGRAENGDILVPPPKPFPVHSTPRLSKSLLSQCLEEVGSIT